MIYKDAIIDLDANGYQVYSPLPFRASKTVAFTSLAQVDTITLTGTSGTATIAAAGGLTKTATFSISLTQTAANFVTANAAAYLAVGIVLTSSGDDLIFTDNDPGKGFTNPTITNATGDLAGSVVNTQANGTVTPDSAGDSGGANATYKLFDVTGAVLVMIVGTCNKTLVGAATLEVGVAGATAALLPQIANATTLAVGEGYADATPSLAESFALAYHVVSLDMNQKITTADITYGEIEYTVFWRPLSDDGNVVAA